MNIYSGESIGVKTQGTFLDLNSRYCVEIGKLKHKNLCLEIEIRNFKSFQSYFETNLQDLLTKLENQENKLKKYMASMPSMSEKYNICLKNNSELAKELCLKTATIRQQEKIIKDLEKEKSQILTQFDNLKELNNNSSSEENLKLKVDIEELQNIIKILNERLKNNIETSDKPRVEEQSSSILKRVYKELEINYLKTVEENKDLKIKLANLVNKYN